MLNYMRSEYYHIRRNRAYLGTVLVLAGNHAYRNYLYEAVFKAVSSSDQPGIRIFSYDDLFLCCCGLPVHLLLLIYKLRFKLEGGFICHGYHLCASGSIPTDRI